MNAHSTHWYSHTDNHRGQLISDIINNSEHIILISNTPTRVPHITLKQATSPDNHNNHNHNNLHNTIQPHNLAHNTRTKLRPPFYNHNNQHMHQMQTTTKQTQIVGKQAGHSSLQTPRLISRTFNLHQTYTLQTPFSQTSSSMQTGTSSQKARYTPHANYFQNT